MRLTANDVKCARCANCVNNELRLRSEEDPDLFWGCERCYLDRAEEKERLMKTQMEAIQYAGWAFDRRHVDTFTNSPDEFDHGRYIDDNLMRLEIMREWRKAVAAIMDAKTMDEVKAMAGMYKEMYFGKKGGEK